MGNIIMKFALAFGVIAVNALRLRGCPDGQVAKGGKCVDAPAFAAGCPDGQVAKGGKCVDAPALSQGCPDGQVAKGGKCVDKPAFAAGCPDGQVAKGGKCVDKPALAQTCPEGRDPEGWQVYRCFPRLQDRREARGWKVRCRLLKTELKKSDQLKEV